MKDLEFTIHMNIVGKETWLNFKDVIEKFLGNRKNENYKIIVEII